MRRFPAQQGRALRREPVAAFGEVGKAAVFCPQVRGTEGLQWLDRRTGWLTGDSRLGIFSIFTLRDHLFGDIELPVRVDHKAVRLEGLE